MEIALVLTATALGFIAAYWLGKLSGSKKSPGGWGAALGIGLCVSFVICILANYLVFGCVTLGFCRRLTDTDLGLALVPVFFMPIYWLVAGLCSQASSKHL
jgi:hypothetical protein